MKVWSTYVDNRHLENPEYFWERLFWCSPCLPSTQTWCHRYLCWVIILKNTPIKWHFETHFLSILQIWQCRRWWWERPPWLKVSSIKKSREDFSSANKRFNFGQRNFRPGSTCVGHKASIMIPSKNGNLAWKWPHF